MRKSFGSEICKLAKKDKKVYLLTGDIGYGIFDEFDQNFETIINLGICEQSLIGLHLEWQRIKTMGILCSLSGLLSKLN